MSANTLCLFFSFFSFFSLTFQTPYNYVALFLFFLGLLFSEPLSIGTTIEQALWGQLFSKKMIME